MSSVEQGGRHIRAVVASALLLAVLGWADITSARLWRPPYGHENSPAFDSFDPESYDSWDQVIFAR